MTPNEIKAFFHQYLKEIDDRPSEKTINIYFTSLEGQVNIWVRQLELVKETIYEKYLPKDVEFIIESLKKNVDLKKNNNFYYTPLNWYKRFCNGYFEYELTNNIAFSIEENQPILDEIEYRMEGGKRIVISIKAERDQRLRKMAIQIHGVICMACGFDLKENTER
ncbi:hypothetical protein BH11BAC6_BH11BAC6_02820 [soil metagenome]